MVLVTVILAVTRSGRSGAVKDRDGDGDSQNSQMVVTSYGYLGDVVRPVRSVDRVPRRQLRRLVFRPLPDSR